MPLRKTGLRPKGRRRAFAIATILALPIAPARAEAPCGTLVIPPNVGVARPAAITGLHPLLGSALANQQIAGVLYRTLLTFAPDHTIDRALSIADRIDVIGDGTGFHVAMKRWNWSDGQPITADDVLYCLELMRTLGDTWGGVGQAGMPGIIKDFHVDGPYDFTVTLTSKVNPKGFILNGLGLFYPLPRHAWGALSTDAMWQRQTDPAFFKVVSGPYRLDRFELSRFLTLEVNPAYGGPAPHVARIIVNFLEGTSELRALQSGEADIANLQFTVWDAAQTLQGFHLITLPPSSGFEYFGLNFRNKAAPDFTDVRVRQAMADAIDQKLIVRLVYHGSADPSYQTLSAEPAAALSPALREGHLPVGYDPDHARALLAEAGWLPGPDGVRQKNGRRFSFPLTIAAGRDTSSAAAQIAQRNLAAVGIDMQIQEVDFSQLVAMTTGDPAGWEAYGLGWSQPPYVEGASLFGTGGVNNNGGYSDARMDRLVKAIDTDTGDAASFAFQDYVAEQQPFIFMPSPRYTVMVRAGIEGVRAFINPLNTWEPEYLQLTGPLACSAAPSRSSTGPDARDHQPS